MLYLDSPSTAGYSVCEDECIYNDEKVVNETLTVMVEFYKKFPEIA